MYRDSGVKAAQTTIYEMMVLKSFEDELAALQERVGGGKVEMMEKLHKMGYGRLLCHVSHFNTRMHCFRLTYQLAVNPPYLIDIQV